MTMLTIKETAAILKLSSSKVYAMVQRGEIPSYRFGSCRRILESDLVAFCESRRHEPTTLPRSKDVHF